MKLTTIKPIALGYREVGSSGEYTPCMGVLKGLSMNQDEPDSTSVDAEFFSSPFDIMYNGESVTLNFELANYTLEELTPLFGGAYNANDDEWENGSSAMATEWEWKLDFGRGNAAFVMYRGLTQGTMKKDEDGALNFAITITALNYTDAHGVDHIYKILPRIEYPSVVDHTAYLSPDGSTFDVINHVLVTDEDNVSVVDHVLIID